MELFFNYLFAILEHFGQDGYKVVLCISTLLLYKYWYIFIKEKILLFSTIFIIYGIVLSFFGLDTTRGIYETLDFAVGWPLSFLLGYTLLQKYSRTNLLILTMSIFAITIIIGLFSYFDVLPHKFIGLRFCDENQLRVFTFRVPFAARCTLMLIISLMLLLFKKDLTTKQKVIFVLFTILFFVALLLSGSRIYYAVSLITLSLIFILYIYKSKTFKILLIFMISTILLGTIVYNSNKSIQNRIKNTSVTKDASISSRIAMYKYAITTFKEHLLFGVGPAQATIQESFYKVKTDDNKKHWHLHSIYLDLLANFGLLGFLLFILIIFLIFNKLYTKYINDNSILALAMIASWASVLVGDIADTVLANPFVASLYFWFTGLALSESKK